MNAEIRYARLSEIALDAQNPRLGRADREGGLSAEEVYELMRAWSLEELATSFLESGFWPHEAVLCIAEEVDGDDRLVVVEGNRRIAALMRLERTYEGTESSRKWRQLIEETARPNELFERVPYILLESRSQIDSFLGFRHVTGIKEWAPPQKAAFIAKLIEESNLGYRDVMRKIGSRTDTVERNYIAFCILRQIEELENFETTVVEERFSVLFLSLRNSSVRRFIGVEQKFGLEPRDVIPPIDNEHLEHLKEYILWLFGQGDRDAIVTDSRDVDKFGRVLASEAGLRYLRNVAKPNLEQAFIAAGGDKEEVYELVATAAYSLQQAISTIHLYAADQRVLDISKLMLDHAGQIKKTLEID